MRLEANEVISVIVIIYPGASFAIQIDTDKLYGIWLDMIN